MKLDSIYSAYFPVRGTDQHLLPVLPGWIPRQGWTDAPPLEPDLGPVKSALS